MKNTKNKSAKIGISLLILILAVIGFSMAACGSDSGVDDDDSGFTSDLSGKTIQLTKNDYSSTKAESKGLQGFFQDPAMMQGKKVNTGDKFKLNITFKVDKTLDEDMWIFMIDNSPAVDYWKGLTSSYAIPKEELAANTEIKIEFILRANDTATSNDAKANTLVFDCNDSWSKSPVTITFVSFTFTKLAASEKASILTVTNFSGSLEQNGLIYGVEEYGSVPEENDVRLLFGDYVEKYPWEGKIYMIVKEIKIKGNTITLSAWEVNEKTYTSAPFTGDKTVAIGSLSLTYIVGKIYKAYSNTVPITFINGNASIDFNTQTTLKETWTDD